MAADCFEVEIESLNLDGKGVAQRDGKPVLIEGALPGERIRYEQVKLKPRYEVGRIVEILQASEHRVEPQCTHFGFFQGACAGCSLQHLEASAQLALKQQTLVDAFSQIGKIHPETLLEPVDGPNWGYRHRARLSARFVRRRQQMLVGFHERARSFVADMQSCAILPERISGLLMPLRELIAGLSIRDRVPQVEVAVGAQTVVMVLRALDVPTDEDCEALLEFGRQHGVSVWLQPGSPETAAPLHGETNGLSLELPEFGVTLPFAPTDFTQINHQINSTLVQRAIELLAPESGEVVVDFFCGLGNFTLPLATRAQHVIGLEGSATLVARAQQAAQKNGLAQRTAFAVRDLFKWTLQDWEALLRGGDHGDWPSGRLDRVLIDPPRAGAFAVAQVLAATAIRPKRVVYVSCNPDTLARDAAVMVQSGAWRLRAAGVVNMFPHTAHVESLAVFDSVP